MRLDIKQRVVETKADLDNIKEEDEETPNTQRVDIHKQLGKAKGFDDQLDKAMKKVNLISKKEIKNMQDIKKELTSAADITSAPGAKAEFQEGEFEA